jgi:hypothetical protein
MVAADVPIGGCCARQYFQKCAVGVSSPRFFVYSMPVILSFSNVRVAPINSAERISAF